MVPPPPILVPARVRCAIEIVHVDNTVENQVDRLAPHRGGDTTDDVTQHGFLDQNRYAIQSPKPAARDFERAVRALRVVKATGAVP